MCTFSHPDGRTTAVYNSKQNPSSNSNKTHPATQFEQRQETENQKVSKARAAKSALAFDRLKAREEQEEARAREEQEEAKAREKNLLAALHRFEQPSPTPSPGVMEALSQVCGDAFKNKPAELSILPPPQQVAQQPLAPPPSPEKTPATKLDRETPDELICPITQEIMHDPVMAMDGHT